MKRTLSVSLIVLALGALAGCGGDDGDGGAGGGGTGPAVEPKLSDIQAKIFTPKCALSSCHGGTEDLSLKAGEALPQMLDRASNKGASKKRLVAGKPDDSLLYVVLKGPFEDVGQMPSGGKLAASEIEAIRQWIADGAQNN